MKKANLSNYDHLLMFKLPVKPKTFRSTQIIGTISVDSDESKLKEMITAGMGIARFDCSLTSVENYEKTLQNLRSAIKSYNMSRRSKKNEGGEGSEDEDYFGDIPVGTALDLKGPTIKTGKAKGNAKFQLTENSEVILTKNKECMEQCDAKRIFVDYPKILNLPKNQIVKIGEVITLRVKDVHENGVNCDVITGGVFEQPMDVFFPGHKTDLSPVNKEFLDALKFANEHFIDMIFVSIQDVPSFNIIKCHINSDENGPKVLVIAKLMGHHAIDNIEKILEKADGVLIERHHLGIIMPPEKVIVAQKCIIAKCLKAGVPCIVSSHMLESISIDGNEATRAEISDIVNAAIDGCDCTMLQKETLGANAIRCIKKMQETLLEAEQMINYRRWYRDILTQVSIPSEIQNCVAASACLASIVSGSSAIIVVTMTGKTARSVAKFRPECPIIVVTTSTNVANQCLILRGTSPIVYKEKYESWQKNVEHGIESALEFIRQSCIIHKYPSTVVAILGQIEGPGNTNTIRLINVTSKPEKQAHQNDAVTSHHDADDNM